MLTIQISYLDECESTQRTPNTTTWMWMSVVLKDVDTLPVVKLQLKCLHVQPHSSDNHSVKAVQLFYVISDGCSRRT